MADETQFDPSEHTVAEVNEHLATADEAERKRVLDAEAAGKNRSTVSPPAGDAPVDAPREASSDDRPVWNTTTHGPAPEGSEGLYRVVTEG